MKVLGIKSAPKQIRYAIVEREIGKDIAFFVNAGAENRLSFPSDIADDLDKRLLWLYTELRRICDHHGQFERMCVKLSEHTGGDTSEKRANSHSRKLGATSSRTNPENASADPLSLWVIPTLKTRCVAERSFQRLDSCTVFGPRVL